MSCLVTGLFSPAFLLNQRWSPPLKVQYSDCNTSRITCDFPSTVVFVQNILNFLQMWLSNFSLNFLSLFRWLRLLLVWSNISRSTIVFFSLYIIIESIVPSRNIGCLWVLSTSVYQLLGTLVHSSVYPLPWLLIFSSCFSVFLSSCFLEGSKVGQPLVLLHPLLNVTNSCVVQNFLKQLFSVICVKWGIIFSLVSPWW